MVVSISAVLIVVSISTVLVVLPVSSDLTGLITGDLRNTTFVGKWCRNIWAATATRMFINWVKVNTSTSSIDVFVVTTGPFSSVACISWWRSNLYDVRWGLNAVISSCASFHTVTVVVVSIRVVVVICIVIVMVEDAFPESTFVVVIVSMAAAIIVKVMVAVRSILFLSPAYGRIVDCCCSAAVISIIWNRSRVAVDPSALSTNMTFVVRGSFGVCLVADLRLIFGNVDSFFSSSPKMRRA